MIKIPVPRDVEQRLFDTYPGGDWPKFVADSFPADNVKYVIDENAVWTHVVFESEVQRVMFNLRYGGIF